MSSTQAFFCGDSYADMRLVLFGFFGAFRFFFGAFRFSLAHFGFLWRISVFPGAFSFVFIYFLCGAFPFIFSYFLCGAFSFVFSYFLSGIKFPC
jgi:hypothetical protein